MSWMRRAAPPPASAVIGAIAVVTMGAVVIFAFVALGPVAYAAIVGGAALVALLTAFMFGVIRRR